MTEVRRASESPFPYGWPGYPDRVCYMELRGGELAWLKERGEIREAVRRALAGESTIYAAWPGQWKTALFVVDDLGKLAKAIDLKPARVMVPGKPTRARQPSRCTKCARVYSARWRRRRLPPETGVHLLCDDCVKEYDRAS